MKKSALLLATLVLLTAFFAVTASADDIVTIDGSEYESIAVGCPYTSTGGLYDGTATDSDANGNPLGKYTDGVIAVNGSDHSIGCYEGKQTEITIDLGHVCEVKRVFTDMYGNSSWGITSPENATVRVWVSEDGKEYDDLGFASMSDNLSSSSEWEKHNFTLDLDETLSARYVRVGYTVEGVFLWSSEIAVYGHRPIIDDELSADESVDEGNTSSVNTEQSVSPESSLDESIDDISVDNGSGNTPLLITIGVIAVVFVAVAAIIITKKKKI